MVCSEAPNTLRIPISLVRCCTVNDTNPNKPKQAIKIVIPEKTKKAVDMAKENGLAEDDAEYVSFDRTNTHHRQFVTNKAYRAYEIAKRINGTYYFFFVIRINFTYECE